MEYLTIRNLEKYHPGYTDRSLIWCKFYFSMMNGEPEFEMLDEIDQWRYCKFVMLQLQTKKAIPIDVKYLARKGFDNKKRAISLTVQMLHNFIEVRNETVTQSRVEYIKKSRVDTLVGFSREVIQYLNDKTNSKFSIDSKTSISIIQARTAEGRTFEDFKKVIDIKVSQWLNDPKMSKYLRPQTLFNNTKFESYINEKPSKDEEIEKKIFRRE